MNSESLQEVRNRLNALIEKNSDYNEILKVSTELDNLIVDYMEQNNKLSKD